MAFDWQRLIPRYWMQNYRTDWEWDATLNRLLDAHEPIQKGSYTVFLGGVEVWVSNYPYAFGGPWEPKLDVLPSVATRKRLRAALGNKQRDDFRAAIASALAKASPHA